MKKLNFGPGKMKNGRILAADKSTGDLRAFFPMSQSRAGKTLSWQRLEDSSGCRKTTYGMKQLLILRHAKSDQSLGVQDFDRPLNPRGMANAPEMGRELRKRTLVPQLIVASPAKRARQTVELMAPDLGYLHEIQWQPNLYFGDIDDYLEIIRSTPPEVDVLLVAGHNPNIERLTALLSTDPGRDIVMKTCAVSNFSLDVQSWDELTAGKNKLEWILDPKMI